jgi:hypothetical protein
VRLDCEVVRGIFGSLLMTWHFCSCPSPRVVRASACQCRQPHCRYRRRSEGHDGYQPCRGTMSRRQLDCRLHLREDRAAIEPVSLSSRRRSGSAIDPPQFSRRLRVHCSPLVVLIHVGCDVVRVGAGEQSIELLKAVAEAILVLDPVPRLRLSSFLMIRDAAVAGAGAPLIPQSIAWNQLLVASWFMGHDLGLGRRLVDPPHVQAPAHTEGSGIRRLHVRSVPRGNTRAERIEQAPLALLAEPVGNEATLRSDDVNGCSWPSSGRHERRQTASLMLMTASAFAASTRDRAISTHRSPRRFS